MRNSDVLLAMTVSASLFTTPWDWKTLAASDCITEPKVSTPGHWYYHLDPVIHRKCWYVGQPGVQTNRPASPQQVSPKSKRETPMVQTVDRSHLGNTERSLPAADTQREVLFKEFLRWQEQRAHSDSLQNERKRDALFREFVFWEVLHADER